MKMYEGSLLMPHEQYMELSQFSDKEPEIQKG